MATGTHTLLERITVGAAGVEEKLFDLARKGDMDAYAALGYVIQKTVTVEGCWTLNGTNLNQNGYTFFSLNKRRKAAHRLLLEILQENLVPEGLVVDHKCHSDATAAGDCKGGLSCRHRACFNPSHMEIVTQRENVARGSRAFWNQETCPQGHPRTEEHIFTNSMGGLSCWTCHKHHSKNAKRAYRARKKVFINGR